MKQKDKMQQSSNLVVAFPLASSVEVYGNVEGVNLVEDRDYRLNVDGFVCGYGNNPPKDVVVFGISTFGWNVTDHPTSVVINRTEYHCQQHCSILSQMSPHVVLVHDYVVQVRYLDGDGARISRDIPHYSLCAIRDGVYSPSEFQEMVHGTTSNGHLESCKWLPCTQSEREENEEDIVLDNGCNENDREYITTGSHFAVRALSLTCLSKFKQEELSLHDRIIVNGLLTIICKHRPISLKAAMEQLIHPHMLCHVLSIFRNATLTSSTESNYRGIVMSEMEDHLRETLGIDTYDTDSDLD